MGVRGLAWLAIISLVSAGPAWAEEGSESSIEQAREALTKKEEDADSAKALEEVFQAAEQSYTLLKKGER
ncbi:MAG TPA: transporter, partial [Pseudomonas sp.]|nr:transporter [Pseudomonas sp.]